jgi:DNA-binding response OmpR family regulator
MKQVLVVDDNQNILNLVEIILKSSGYGCTKANTAKQALELIHNNNNNYDLILMDLAMPEMSGIDVLKRLKEEGLLDKRKVVFFTASSLTEAEKDDLRNLGALDAMKKPFSKAELLEFIGEHIR